MTKNISTLVVVTILLAFSQIAKAQDNVIDEIIWVVGDEAILKSDVEAQKEAMIFRGEKLEGDPYCFIPEQLAMQKLFLDQAKIDSIEVGDNELHRHLARYEKMQIEYAGTKEKLEEYSRAPLTELRDRWRDEIRNSALIERAQSSIMEKTKALTPSEVRKFYNELPKDSLPYIPPAVEVQIITADPHIPLEVTDEIKARLREYTRRITNGESSFASLAIMYSEDGSSANGGELGFMGRAQLVPEFSNVAFALSDPEKVSNVVESEYGFHIIQLIERRGDVANFRHILLQAKIPEDELEKTKARLDSLASDIKEEKVGFDEAAMLVSSDKTTRGNGGVMVNKGPSGFEVNPRFSLEELPPDIAQAVNALKVGEISKAFVYTQASGKKVVAIVKLRNKVDGHVANVSDDYQTLKEIVEQRKKNEALQKWLKGKIEDTYVRINTNWANCEFQYKGWGKNNKN